jgi:Flp pilus assembly protein TadD
MTSDPDIGTALTMVNHYKVAGNFRRAEEVVREALVHNPHNAQLLTELALVQYFLGDKGAEHSVRKALAYEPENAYAMRILAAILVEQGRQREGLECARKAVNAAPFDHSMHYEYARLLATSGLPVEALPVADEALRLAPDDADTHDLRGVILGMLGRLKESTAEHEKALQLAPGHARALSNIAVNRANSRNLAGALAGFTEAGRLDPHIGDEIRRNVTATVRQWLSWTIVAAWAALWLINQLERNNDGPTTQGARVIAGLGFFVLLVMFGWLARSLPRQLWGPILRQREFRSLKIYLGLGIVVLGVLGVVAVGAPVNIWVLLGTLLATVAVSWIAPRFDKDWWRERMAPK